MQKIAIVVPCFNESKRLDKLAFENFLKEYGDSFFILFVNDGSTDSTGVMLNDLCEKNPQHFYHLDFEINRGKGEAVRQGMMKCYEMNQFSYIGYFDADLATPLSELLQLQAIAIKNPKFELIFCSRIIRIGADIKRKPQRQILGRIFSIFASMVVKLPIYDTQCGAKIIKNDTVPVVCGEHFLTSWLFDTEILLRLRNKQKEQAKNVIYEYPVSKWDDIPGSKLKLIHMLKIPLQLIKIHIKYNY